MNKNSNKASYWKEVFNVKSICINALIAALYAVLTYLGNLLGLSYSYMQFRFSEFLMLLVFFNPHYTLGLTIGCLLANLISSAGIYDITLGTLATFISCILMILFSKKVKSLFLTGLIPCFINAFMVPLIIYLACIGTDGAFNMTGMVYFIMWGWVLLGELLSINVFGYVIFMGLKHYHNFDKLIDAKRNADFKW